MPIFRSLALLTIPLAIAVVAHAQDAVALRKAGVTYAAKGDYPRAADYLRQSAELGFYTAQVEYAYLLESSPAPVANPIEAYAWALLVIARNGPDTAFATDIRKRVSTKLTPEQLKQAEARSDELKTRLGTTRP